MLSKLKAACRHNNMYGGHHVHELNMCGGMVTYFFVNLFLTWLQYVMNKSPFKCAVEFLHVQ